MDANSTLTAPGYDGSLAVALDIGTSSVRAMIFDLRGAPSSEAQIKYAQTTTQDGGVEVDAEELLGVCVDCLEKLLNDCSVPKTRIKCLGISCFWHSLVGVGSNKLAATPVYSWADTRASGQVSKLRSLFEADSYHARTGCELHPCFWPAKLLWLREMRPQLVAQTNCWMGFGEYLRLRLFGNSASSISMASGTGLFDQKAADWDDQILENLYVSRDALCIISDSPSVGIKDEFGDRLPAVANIPWFPAFGDGACSNIGSGGHDDSRIVLNVGTSAAMRIASAVDEKAHLDIARRLFCYRVDRSNVLIGGAFANGGNVYAWLKKQFRWRDDSKFNRDMAEIEPDSHGLTVLPFWAGERSPGWNSNARAAILGMNLHTSSADIVRASLEACAYSFDSTRKQIAERFSQAKELIVSGGAIGGSSLFGQIICDVFGTDIAVATVSEASSRGAALLAFHSVGLLPSFSHAPIHVSTTFHPDGKNHSVYASAAERYNEYYRKIYPT